MQEAGKQATDARLSLCFGNAEVTSLLTFALDSHFLCQITSHANVGNATAALQKGAPQLLVLDGSLEGAEGLLEAAKAAKCKVGLYHQKKQAPKTQGVDLAGPFNEDELLPGLTELLKKMGVAERGGPHEVPAIPFVRVGVPLLLRTSPLVSDIFIRLSELKYVKLFHKAASFTKEDVDKYHDTKKVEFFYVKREEAESTSAKLNDALEDLLKQQKVPPEVSTQVSIATIETVHSLVNQVGFTPEVQRLVKNNVDVVMKELYASPSLGSILKNMQINKDKYIASHSHMLSEVSCALSIAMKWDSDTSFKKLTMASVLHDMSLSNHRLASIKDMKELEKRRSEFTPGEIEEYKNHTKRAATLVKGMKEVPADVDKIIMQHHEHPMGTGFPDALNNTHIHPLAAIMMVAHDLVDWVIDHPSAQPDINGFLEAYIDKYKVGNFKKILKGLDSLQV
ncbi:MAG TPA: HD domain-containing phosphohydrolase [Bdellovibrionota bacterium]